jgi:hypothetical protein
MIWSYVWMYVSICLSRSTHPPSHTAPPPRDSPVTMTPPPAAGTWYSLRVAKSIRKGVHASRPSSVAALTSPIVVVLWSCVLYVPALCVCG